MSIYHPRGKHKRTLFVGTRGVKEYRSTIPNYVDNSDTVLEIGCEWGATTVLLAERCQEVIGTDIGEDAIRRARISHPQLRFEVLDAWDMAGILRLGRKFTKIYVDISGLSGYNSLLDLIALLTMYEATLHPAVIVVKSGALKQFASRCVAWNEVKP